MKIVSKQENKSGLLYALVIKDNGNYLVMVYKTNYVRGRNVSKWVVCNKYRQDNNDFQNMVRCGMSLDEASAMYEKKLKGRQKY